MALQTDGVMLLEEVVEVFLAEVALEVEVFEEVFEVVMQEVFRGEAPGLASLVVQLVIWLHIAPREVHRLLLEAVLWLDLRQEFLLNS